MTPKQQVLQMLPITRCIYMGANARLVIPGYEWPILFGGWTIFTHCDDCTIEAVITDLHKSARAAWKAAAQIIYGADHNG